MGRSAVARTAQAGVAALLVGVTASGCAEVVKGPRVVRYTDTSFYIRHIALLNGAETVNEIAGSLCLEQNRSAVLTDAYQDVPVGIRYATYECISLGPERSGG
jgi:hypothetical protein